MRFRLWFLLGSITVGAGITGTGIYYLHKAAVESERVRQVEEAESACAGRVSLAVELVQRKDSMEGARIQVTGSTSHFNHQLRQCLVEVSTYEHQDAGVFVKSMVNTASQSLVLWSIATDDRNMHRTCFSENAKEMACGELDSEWKRLMKE